MEYKKLGNTDLKTAPVVFGGNVFGWTLNEKQSFEILDEVMASGFNTIDTADVYSRWVEGNQGGESESIIGKWMKDRGVRNKITLITKVGSDMGQGHRDLTEKYILKAAEDSLRRLQTDHIDLYLSHWDDERTPAGETLGAYEKLIKAGKVRYIGASNLSSERLSEFIDVSEKNGLPRYDVFQPEYNLYARQGFETGVGPVCRAKGLGVITYFSLASGFLTGKYRAEGDFGKSIRGEGMQKYFDERGTQILAALDDLAAARQVSPASVALAWLLHKPDVTAPIASVTKTAHLKSFIEASQLSLTPDDMEQLDKASAY